MTHKLKIWLEYYEEVFKGYKTFELRKNDRDFKKGDILILKEWDNCKKEYTGRLLIRSVLYIIEGGKLGLEIGYVIMSIG